MNIFPSQDNFPSEKISDVMLSPLAVLKELIENAVDSEATVIKISVEGNGIGKITVADNGCGIDYIDTKYLLKEGFTSKIKGKPLQNGSYPLGWRGKSLFAIASISKIKIASKQADGQGFELTCNFGLSELKKTYLEKSGTIVQITNLYLQDNLLREKHKTDRSLKSLINRCVIDYALNNENISFQYSVDGKPVFSKPACPLKEALQYIFGATLSGDILKEIDWHCGGIALKGITIFPPEGLDTSFGNYNCIALQGRSICSEALNNTIKGVYKYYFLTSKLPLFFIKIQMPFKDVEFDCDALKQTPKFLSEKNLCDCVKECLAKSLYFQYYTRKRFNFTLPKSKISYKQYTLKEDVKPLCFISLNKNNDGEIIQSQNLDNFEKLLAAQRNNNGNRDFKINTFTNTNVLGLLFNKYIVAARENFFYFIDYNAARALFYYDSYISQFESETVVISKLFSPFAFKLNGNSANQLDKFQNLLKSAGFIFSRINEGYYKLDAIPEIFMGMLNCQSFLNCLILRLNDFHSEISVNEIALCACDCLTFNTVNLTITDLKSFVKDFEGKRFRKTPKGNEIVIVYTADDLKERFEGRGGIK